MFILKSIMCVAKSCTLHKVTSKGSSRKSILQGSGCWKLQPQPLSRYPQNPGCLCNLYRQQSDEPGRQEGSLAQHDSVAGIGSNFGSLAPSGLF